MNSELLKFPKQHVNWVFFFSTIRTVVGSQFVWEKLSRLFFSDGRILCRKPLLVALIVDFLLRWCSVQAFPRNNSAHRTANNQYDVTAHHCRLGGQNSYKLKEEEEATTNVQGSSSKEGHLAKTLDLASWTAILELSCGDVPICAKKKQGA